MSLLKLPFLNRYSEPHTIGGAEVQVFRASTSMLQKLRVVAKPVLRSFVTLFANTDKDAGVEQKQSRTGEDFFHEVKSSAVSTDTIRVRNEQRTAAVDLLIDSLLGDGSKLLLAALISDALKQPEPSSTEADEFFKTLGIDTLQELLTAIWRVNEKTFAPLMERAGMSSAALKEAVQSKLRVVGKATEETSPISSSSSAAT